MSAPFLTPAEVTELWDLWKEGLIDTCVVKARVEVPNTARGTVLGNPAVTQTVACVQLSQAAALQAGLLPDESTGAPDNVIAFAREITIKAGDEIEVNGNGITWAVQGDPKAPGTYDPCIFANCSQRKKEPS